MTKYIAMVTIAAVDICMECSATEDGYEVFCTNVVAAFTNKTRLASPGFTNQLQVCLSNADVRVRSLAELTLAFSRFEIFETSLGTEYDEGCRFCTNVLYSVGLPERCWQKSVASLLYSSALHMDGKREQALNVCRAALSIHLASPTTEVERAVWSVISRVDGETEFDITNSLRIAAALSVPVERRSSEWGVYTNNMPSRAIQVLVE